jgi:hypothetical protein
MICHQKLYVGGNAQVSAPQVCTTLSWNPRELSGDLHPGRS